MNTEQLQNLLQQVKDSSVTIDEAVGKLRHLPFEDLKFAWLDHHRQIRWGFAVFIYSKGKTTGQIIEIFAQLEKKEHNVLATRVEKHVYEEFAATGRFPQAEYNELAKTILLEQQPLEPSDHYIAIITAGTADMPVATEAMVTCRAMGQQSKIICDVGVAGIHRLLGDSETMEMLKNATAAVVVAGMEGALASVVGGLVDCPVVAVPTSVGYGASFEGLAALLAMLNSCAAGVTVVNIDNGFGAGYAASVINRKIRNKD
jgi:NCAIR mutase (PurE)-related protein